jgi:hypothetical protein
MMQFQIEIQEETSGQTSPYEATVYDSVLNLTFTEIRNCWRDINTLRRVRCYESSVYCLAQHYIIFANITLRNYTIFSALNICLLKYIVFYSHVD